MKKVINSAVSVCLAIVFVLSFTACGDRMQKNGLWENAMYLKDTEFGDGENTVTVEVKAEDQSVTFTINTDSKTVGDALMEHGLIEGEEGQYGLYVKVVNGMTADYDIDQSYWAFYVDGEYAVKGVDSTEITEGVTYQLVCTKQ